MSQKKLFGASDEVAGGEHMPGVLQHVWRPFGKLTLGRTWATAALGMPCQHRQFGPQILSQIPNYGN